MLPYGFPKSSASGFEKDINFHLYLHFPWVLGPTPQYIYETLHWSGENQLSFVFPEHILDSFAGDLLHRDSFRKYACSLCLLVVWMEVMSFNLFLALLYLLPLTSKIFFGSTNQRVLSKSGDYPENMEPHF